MRHEKGELLLRLALDMQAARGGLTLADIQARYGIGKRTAMRLRDAVVRVFPQVEERFGDDRLKRWRIPTGTLNRLLDITAEDLAALEAAAQIMEEASRPLETARLAGLSARLRALLSDRTALRLDPDLEALMEAEGLACRPGPRPRLDPALLTTLHEAFKAARAVRVVYASRRDPTPRPRVLHPHGLLYGHRHYLVARQSDPDTPGVRLFALGRLRAVTLLDQPLAREPGFDLARYARQAFGVFQEPPVAVVWRFSAAAAAEARGHLFHPDQEMEDQPDGSLVVRFVAGGLLEMAWHLFTWGTHVEVLEPPALAALVHPHRVAWDALP